LLWFLPFLAKVKQKLSKFKQFARTGGEQFIVNAPMGSHRIAEPDKHQDKN